MPAALRVKKVGFKGIYFSPKKLFVLKCNEYKDELIEQVKAPFEAAREEAEQQFKQPFDDLKQGFDAFIAEKAREKILPTLPKEQQERFKTDTAFMQEKVHDWLKDPNQETSEYVSAYIQSRYSRLYKAYETYVDLTNGQSKEIVDGLNGILEKAQGRLKSVLGLVREVEADPETPWTDKAKEYGLSGYWVDRFKGHEGEIREINDRTKVIDAAQIVVGAFQTDDSVAKIGALFDVMETLAGAASDSNVPIASLFGDIVAAYAKVAKETLAAVNALGEKLKARAGYCFGPGVPLGSQSSARYREAEVAAREIPDTLLCPLGIGVAPWKDIYQQVEPGPQDQLHFWADGTFVRGAAAGGGRYGAQESLKLMQSAREIGYAVPELAAGDTRPIADVYNVPFGGASGNGIPGLMAEARSVIEEIDNKIARLTSAPAYTGQCAADAVLKHVARQAGLNLAAFRDERDRYGVGRLIATYAASYAAGHGAFGEAGGARAGAYDNYRKIRDGLKNVSIVVVHGSVRDTNRGYGVPCPECGGAAISVSVAGGDQVAGCEVTKADETGDFIVVAVRASPTMSIALGADVNGVKGETVTVDNAYLANGSLDTSGVFLSTSAFLPVDLAPKFAQTAETQPGEQPPPGSGDGLPKTDTEATEAKEVAEQAVRCAAERAKLAAAKVHIERGSFNDAERILVNVSPSLCPAIAPEFANAKARVASAAAGLAGNAEAARRSCEPTRWTEMAQRLRRVENTGLTSLAAALETMAATYSSAQSDLASARTLYSEGKFDQSVQQLEEALGRLGALPRQGQCKEVLAEIEDALDKARKVATGLTKVDEAIAACDVKRLPSLISQLAAVKQPHQTMIAKKSEASSLVDALSAATKQLQSVAALKGAGKLDEAKARIVALTTSIEQQGLKRCKIYAEALSEAEEVAGSLEGATQAEAAVAGCDLAAIDGLIASLASSAKGNDKRTTVSLKKGRAACNERKRKEELATVTEACRRKHGQAAYATERKPDEFYCECKKPYIFDKQAQRCRTNEEIIAEGTEVCRGELGAAAFAKRQNADGTFECFCEKGFDLNATKSACERRKSTQEILAEGGEICRNQFGPGFYAQRKLSNGEFHCVCQAGLYFDEANSRCVQPTAEDGHQACKATYGADSYLISINNDGTYQCYIPQQQQSPQAGGPCPQGYWINPKTGRCISAKELFEPLIPTIRGLGGISPLR